jgi:polyphenol oxidase
VADKPNVMSPLAPGLFKFSLPGNCKIIAGVTDRTIKHSDLALSLPFDLNIVQSQQVHGASIASIEGLCSVNDPITGCDAISTDSFSVCLAVRTADCLPIFIFDQVKNIVGIAHAGWRGLSKKLPAKLVVFLQNRYSCKPADLYALIGPAIRSCCYSVGKEFEKDFDGFLSEKQGRLVCDLIGNAAWQLISAGVLKSKIIDSGECTQCNQEQWISYRASPRTQDRLVSFAALSAPRRNK